MAISIGLFAQVSVMLPQPDPIKDSLFNTSQFKYQVQDYKNPFPYKSFILPVSMITVGLLSHHSNHLQEVNKLVKEEVWTEEPHSKTSIDNYLVFAPAVAVYGLNLAGIKGKNNFRDRTIIYTMSSLIAASSVFGLKQITHVQRPDGSDYHSFPSGHTALAFASAEFLRMEYKDVSPWYGIAGYATATATGFLRMYNNKHWAGDVVAGAGIGILSTRLAYWLYPTIKRTFSKDKPMNTFIMPYYQPGQGAGVSMVMNLK